MNDLMIDYFMAVATNLSFTKTSEELYVSQPAISRQISLLEKELDAKLFKRNNQKTELTEVGKLYFDLFSRYKAELLNTRCEAAQILGKKKGMVRVGFLEGWDLFNIIPQMMDRFHAEFPESEVTINCCGIKELTTALLTDSIDIAVTMKNSVSNYFEFETRDVAQIGKLLLFSVDHHLADKEGITLRDFSREPFIAPWEIADKLIIDAIASYTRPYGFIPELKFVKNHESLITCVRNNLGVAIVDDWVWAKDAADLKWIRFNASDTVAVSRIKTRTNEPVLFMEKIIEDVIYEQESGKQS